MSDIFLIENQFTQYKKIAKLLTNHGLSVFPTENSYIHIINLVRIFLNDRYTGGLVDGSRRSNAFKELFSNIERELPQLIIIDHILVGHHQAKDGLFLAIELRKKNIQQPLLFLSRTQENNIDILKQYPNINGVKDWAHKGNPNDGFLDPNHFQLFVWPKISDLIGNTDLQKGYSCKLFYILNLECFKAEEYYIELKKLSIKIINKLDTNINLRNAIDTFISEKNRNEEKRIKFIEILKANSE